MITVGIDFGTLSARAVALDTDTGKEVACGEFPYPHAVMDRCLPDGTELPPQYALQHPQDYLDALQAVIGQVLGSVKKEAVAALCIDFTTATVLPVNKEGTPLCFLPAFQSEPHAYVKLWKHHGAVKQAKKFDDAAKARKESWLKNYGDTSSSEWMFPKILETLEEAPAVYEAAYRFYDAADWLSLVLTGREVLNPCMASLKAYWNEKTGYPGRDYFQAVDPRLEHVVGTKICDNVGHVAEIVGQLSETGCRITGLTEKTSLVMPLGDAHAAMAAMNVVKPGQAMVVIGTSGVVLANTEKTPHVPGICGLTQGGVFPGVCTMEAGQAGLGDCFDWFVKQFGLSHEEMTKKAAALRPGQSRLIALDWWSGNRSILKNDNLSGMILGLNLQTRPEEIYRALIEATAFGLRIIVENYEAHGVKIGDICAAGGIAMKNPMLMQIYADVLGRTLTVGGSAQAGARGSAMFAAVAAGACPDLVAAAEKYALPATAVYQPNPEHVTVYDKLYAEYKRLHDYFGKENPVMDRLLG